jgi:hypothetical protein
LGDFPDAVWKMARPGQGLAAQPITPLTTLASNSPTSVRV